MPQLREQFNSGVTEALLRLGSLAAEAQEVVDSLVEERMGRCVVIEGPDAVRITLAGLANQPQYLVRELLIAVWRRQGWPMQAMGRREWDELSVLAASVSLPRRSLPGGVALEVTDGTMWLRAASERMSDRSVDEPSF